PANPRATLQGPPPSGRIAPPPPVPVMRSAAPPPPPPQPRVARLMLHYQGEQFEVSKERFILGRSKQGADLRLNHSNVSREHAAIERVGQAWFLVDLGSTNGVMVRGERITRPPISNGDLIVITSHEIHCELR